MFPNFQFSYVFWLGDLNYRINESVENIQGLVAKKDYASLWPHDQVYSKFIFTVPGY